MTTPQPLDVSAPVGTVTVPAPLRPDTASAPVSLVGRGFPDGFILGAATAAYQIEGAATTDGRTPSIWDTFSQTPGRVVGGHTGDVATDHYHRYGDDIALMASLGLTSYRFSVSWSRVQPSGAGPANPLGLDFYRHLVDGLLEHGIQPWLTLYHWDLPQPIEDAGGWPARDTAARFAEYASIVYGALGDRVPYWTTLNEPWCSAFLGYGSGEHAPGRRDPAASVRAAHHLMLGHGMALDAIHAQRADAQVGITLNLYAVSAATDSPADLDAARRIDGMSNRLFLDPLLLGRYPEDVLRDLGQVTDFSHVRDGDLAVISRPLSMLGINYYSRHVVAGGETAGGAGGADGGPQHLPGQSDGSGPRNVDEGVSQWRGGRPPSAYPGSESVRFVPRGLPVTAMGWEIDAPGLTEVLTRVARDYPALPLYITENGAAFADEISAAGAVEDTDRRAYLDAHLNACLDAVAAGAPLRGYFAWSLLDNYEWSWGYTRRFGLVYVDYRNQRRIPKASARWYSDVIRQHSIPAYTPPDAATVE